MSALGGLTVVRISICCYYRTFIFEVRKTEIRAVIMNLVKKKIFNLAKQNNEFKFFRENLEYYQRVIRLHVPRLQK